MFAQKFKTLKVQKVAIRNIYLIDVMTKTIFINRFNKDKENIIYELISYKSLI